MVADHGLRRRARAGIAILIVILVVASVGGGLGILWLSSTGHSQTEPKADGPTFYQAISAVNGSVSNQSGGPWTLFGVWGIATPIPFAPNALGWFANNYTVNSCGAQFNGLTLWNGSIPLFNGGFDSGTAPFWQFAFFSNASHTILIATNVLGKTQVYPPMAMSSRCAEATGLGADPWNWAPILVPFPPNSPIMAESAWNAIGDKWTNANEPGYEKFVFGYSYWGSGNPIGRIVGFARCGEIDATGVQPYADVIVNDNGSWNSYDNGSEGCGDVISLGPPPVYGSYELDFSPPIISSENSTATFNESFQVTYGNRTADSDAGGLVAWMTTLGVSNDTGNRLPSAIPGCSAWVPTLKDCRYNDSGWYAVLLSSNGAWLDSYPSTSNGTAWEIPNVSIVSNQFIVEVFPNSWNVSGNVFSIYGTVTAVPVGGSVTL